MRAVTIQLQCSCQHLIQSVSGRTYPILLAIVSVLVVTQLAHLDPLKQSASEPDSRQGVISQARLSESISVRAAGRGNPYINLSDGRDVITGYDGPAELVEALEQNNVKPLSLASADYDEDGVPDLVSGYGGSEGGIITIHRGNVDSIYPNSPEAKQRRVIGEFTDAPFLSPGQAFGVPEAVDFVGAGDFDCDGHWDVVTAARGSNIIYLLSGDGRGSLREGKAVELPGRVTVLATGEINRRDGLDDVVVAIAGTDGAKALVFEGPEGALRAAPEVFALPAEATSLALGQLDNGYTIDLAIAAGRELIVVQGRDRKLSLDDIRRADVGPAKISRRSFSSSITSIAIGNLTGSQKAEIAMLSADGEVLVIGARGQSAEDIQKWKVKNRVKVSASAGLLVRARVSSVPVDNLVVVDSTGQRLQIITCKDNERREPASSSIPEIQATLNADSEPVGAIPMRLNGDALSDLVMLRSGSTAQAVAMTQPMATFTVTNTNDSGPGSLRQAIIDSNSSVGSDLIAFSIGSGVQTITPTSPLPQFDDPIMIDGTTQPGFAGSPVIELNGASSGSKTGLQLTSGSSVVRGLVINRFSNGSGDIPGGIAIFLATAMVEGNYIGTDVTGTIDRGNLNGVYIIEGVNSTIGGTTTAARNIISGNDGSGINICCSFAMGNLIQGNFIGTDVTGTVALGNVLNIHIYSANNTIGGTAAGARNIISGTASTDDPNAGVVIAGIGATGNLVQGNFVGTDVSGTAALGNLGGVAISQAVNNTIGGTTPSARNVISGNDGFGLKIQINGATGNLVQGNLIGTDVSGTIDLGNDNNVQIFDASNNTIGGTSVGARNLISGASNVAGISIGSAPGTVVHGNFIGTDISGNIALGNSGDGISISQSPGVLIGGTTVGARNIVSANGGNGIIIGFAVNSGGQQFIGQTGATVQGNYIGVGANGTTPLGNGSCGIFVDGDSVTNTIEGNLIANNGGGGVCIPNNTPNLANPGLRILILTNTIISNQGIGIDLGPSGVTPNDARDQDGGANLLQNYPALTSATMISSSRPTLAGDASSPSTTGTIRIVGNLNSTPNTDFFVQFFSAQLCTNSNPGGNQQELNFLPILFHTDASGNAPIDVTFENVTVVGGWVNALARDPSGNTSEFSQCIFVNTSAGCSFSISPTGQSFPSGGGTGSFTVTAGTGCVWTAVSNDPFITITTGPDGTGNGSVGFQVEANPGSTNRTGTVTIAGQTLTITQQGTPAPCTFSLNSAGQNITASGGSGSFTVTTQGGCNWSPITDIGWVTATRSGSTVNYRVESNGSAQRQGHISVQDQVFTVTQDGAAVVCTYSISPASADFTASGGNGSFTLTTGPACSWNAAANVPWITVPFSGVGGGMINFTVAPNSGPPRTGQIFVEGQQITVDQAASCAFALNETHKSFAANGGSGSLTVTTGVGCVWTATSNNPGFITITSGDIASGSDTVTYSVTANTGSAIRSGTITVAGQTYTVYQGMQFADVAVSHPFYSEIGRLSARQVTLGCSPTSYCPDDVVTRQQMAAFIIRALGDFSPPPPAQQRFLDVPPTNPFYAFIEQMAIRQITLGCGGGNYCPADPVLRDQMAAFIIRGLGEFNPPIPPFQRFLDVPPSNPFYRFIDRMAVLQITLGCGGGNYCPSLAVTRGQMAAFLVRAFNL